MPVHLLRFATCARADGVVIQSESDDLENVTVWPSKIGTAYGSLLVVMQLCMGMEGMGNGIQVVLKTNN